MAENDDSTASSAEAMSDHDLTMMVSEAPSAELAVHVASAGGRAAAGNQRLIAACLHEAAMRLARLT